MTAGPGWFDGKVVVVVTGAGSGIGAAAGDRFLAEGARVVYADRDAGRLSRTAASESALPVAVDVADPAPVSGLWRRQGPAVAPGTIRTNINADVQSLPEGGSPLYAFPPARRWGDPEDLAGPIVFLASPDADYITGSVLVVDGGQISLNGVVQ